MSIGGYLLFSTLLFGIGLTGIVLNRKNLLTLLMSIEILLLAVNTNFIVFSHFLNDTLGQVMVFFVLTIAAAEAAIGLAIVVALFRNKRAIDIEALNDLKG